MKIVYTLLIILLLSINSFGKNNGESEHMFYISFDEKELACEFAESRAAEELKEILKNGAITINMENYGGFEKVGELPKKLSKKDESISASSGDILLYQGRYMVIMYGNNSWSYTRLGKIKGLSSSEIYNILSKAGNNIKVYMK